MARGQDGACKSLELKEKTDAHWPYCRLKSAPSTNPTADWVGSLNRDLSYDLDTITELQIPEDSWGLWSEKFCLLSFFQDFCHCCLLCFVHLFFSLFSQLYFDFLIFLIWVNIVLSFSGSFWSSFALSLILSLLSSFPVSQSLDDFLCPSFFLLISFFTFIFLFSLYSLESPIMVKSLY